MSWTDCKCYSIISLTILGFVSLAGFIVFVTLYATNTGGGTIVPISTTYSNVEPNNFTECNYVNCGYGYACSQCNLVCGTMYAKSYTFQYHYADSDQTIRITCFKNYKNCYETDTICLNQLAIIKNDANVQAWYCSNVPERPYEIYPTECLANEGTRATFLVLFIILLFISIISCTTCCCWCSHGSSMC